MSLPRRIWVAGLFLAFLLGIVLSAPPVLPANQRQGFLSDRAPSNGASATDYGSVSAGDKDCGDFSSHAQAQTFFDAQGAGDPHRLDGDDDGVACEQLR